MPSVERIIWNKLHIHRNDTLPYTGSPWDMKSNRETLAEVFAEAGFKLGAEIGVEFGKYTIELCNIIPGVKIICVDPWKAYANNSDEREERIYQDAMNRLVGRNVEIMRISSLEASQKIPDGSLDFVYIDALHNFDGVMMDIILWSPKVRSGGIVSGHDYIPYYQFGVIQAVNAYTAVHNIHIWYVTSDRVPSWFWVKR